MSQKIDKDLSRFRKILRGKIRKDLKKYITHSDMIGKKGKDLVSIPVSHISIPHFRFDPMKGGGVGQGDGPPGTPLGPGQQQGQGAGNSPGQHIIEVEMSLEELAQIMAEELELPNIQPKGKNTVITEHDRYFGIRQAGPESLRIMKRTYKTALKRQIMTQTYDPDNPVIVPIREDRRYRSWKERPVPESNAVIIYMMDVSGSMGDEQKEIVRTEAFWIDTWLRSQYKALKTRYIIHDAVAREVDEKTFYHTRESGGTIISSAYKLCNLIIDNHYNPQEWNIYLFHFSDGDNWGEIDTAECIGLLHNQLIEKSNLFCYGQVESPYGSGQFINNLKDHFSDNEKVALSEIMDRDGIYTSIKEFLRKGR